MVAGWELTTEDDDFISWFGYGGSPPAGFVADETTAIVTALSHGGRWENRWTTRVKYEGPGRDGEEHSTTSTIASYTLTFSTGDRGFAKNRARAIEAAVEWMEDHPSKDMSDDNPEPEEESSGSRQTIEFGQLDAANEWRDDNEEHLCSDDNRTTKTVLFHRGVPTDVVDDARTKALASREGERKTYGQAKLSEDEKRYLDRNYDTWEWKKYGFEAMAAKAALQAEGAINWLNYYEPGEGIDGSLANMERGKEMQALTGAPTGIEGGYIDSDPDISEQAKMAARAIGEACTHALAWCEEGDDVACEYLVSDCGWTEEDVAEFAERVEAFEVEMDDLLTDDGGRVEPGQPLEAAAVPETDEIPGFAKGTLKRAWTGYSVAVREAAGYLEAAEEFEARRAEAERYAQIVNEVRKRFGQEPMSFDRLGELNEVSPVELTDAPTNEENTTGFRAAVEWSQRTVSGLVGDVPYDPVEDVGGAAASDLEKARALHATRSEKAQSMDESIKAREQVTDFEEWAEAPNMVDFVGVDDLESVLGIGT
jgi:hypothetical protein